MTQITGTTGTSQNDTAVNPESKLDKDDFLQLLLTELQYQDPTAPMESETILNQTSQLATLETQQNTNKVMEELAATFKSSLNYSVISAVGKTARINDFIALEEGSSVSFDLNFEQTVKSGTIQIYDVAGTLIKSIELNEGISGMQSYEWTGTNNEGDMVSPGPYTVSAAYLDQSGNLQEAKYGTYEIEAVRFDSGQAYVKIGSNYISLDDVLEIY